MAKSDAIRTDRMWSEISDSTGFDAGEQFTNEQQVREYFTVENMRDMFSGETELDQSTLDSYADVVIEHKRHCSFQ